MHADPAFENAAAEIAREAGDLLLTHLGHVAVEYKGEADLVTAADRASEALITRRLRERFPEHAMVAEEGSRTEGAGGFRWHVDPLDGTTNFAHRLPFFCVSLGLETGREIVAGAVYNPVLREMFSATQGRGARLNGAPIAVSPMASLREAIVATGFPSRKRHRNPNIHFYHAVTLSTQGVRRFGSAALDLCYTACGRFDAFWEFHLNSWDVAAGSLILTEAGGILSDMVGRPYTFTAPEILASNGHIHAELLALFGDIFAGREPALPSPAAYLRERGPSSAGRAPVPGTTP